MSYGDLQRITGVLMALPSEPGTSSRSVFQDSVLQDHSAHDYLRPDAARLRAPPLSVLGCLAAAARPFPAWCIPFDGVVSATAVAAFAVAATGRPPYWQARIDRV